MPQRDRKRAWPCGLVGYVEEYAWGNGDTTAAYVIESADERWGTGTHAYMMRADDVWKLLTKERQKERCKEGCPREKVLVGVEHQFPGT